jgi:HEAT repeat protein
VLGYLTSMSVSCRRSIARGAVLLLASCSATPVKERPAHEAPPVAATAPVDASKLFWPQLFDPTPFDLKTATYGVREPGLAVIDLNDFGESRRTEPVSKLLAKLTDGSDEERSRAALEVGELCFGFSFWGVRWCVPEQEDLVQMRRAVHRGSIGARPRALIPVMVRALDDPNPEVRKRIALSLEYIGPVAMDACPRLRRALGDADPRVRLWSARALHVISGEIPGPLDTSVTLLDDPDPDIRTSAAYNLNLMMNDAYMAIPFLEKHLDDPVQGVRTQVQQALEHIKR